ncbi:MAG: universal stress protein [Gillisia sp.]
MTQLSKILLLTDFSEVSENAAMYALQIAEIIKVEVHILHVVNTPVVWNKLPLEKEKLYPETREEISDAKVKLKELARKFENKGIITHPLIEFNLGAESIATYMKFDGIELIIMGSHGSKGIMDFSLGSNTQKILRTITKPILVVKNPPPREEIKRIGFASTFEEKQKNAFNKVVNLANLLKANVELLFINTPYNFRETQEIDIVIADFCEGDIENICRKHTINANNETRGIKYFMQENEIDIFSIATGTKSGLAQFFVPSLTEVIINHLEVPVLSIHQKEK